MSGKGIQGSNNFFVHAVYQKPHIHSLHGSSSFYGITIAVRWRERQADVFASCANHAASTLWRLPGTNELSNRFSSGLKNASAECDSLLSWSMQVCYMFNCMP